MQVYTVHRPPFAGRDAEPLLLREGFCWPAALFSVIWALAHRMWWTAFGLLVAALALEAALAATGLDQGAGFAVFCGYAVIAGLFGNDWRRAALDRAGWRFDGVVAAAGADAALRRLVDLGGDGWTGAAPPSRPLA